LIQIAEVCINVQASRLRHPFSYAVPAEFSFIGPGWRVVVPFGSIEVEGFVVAVRSSESEDDARLLKSVRDVPDIEAWFDKEMLATASWLSDYYVCSLGEALRLFIPGKSGIKKESFFAVAAESSKPIGASKIFDFILKRGTIGFNRLRAEFGAGCRNELEQLLQKGLLVAHQQTRQRVKTKWIRILRLNMSQFDITSILAGWKGKPAQKRILERLLSEQKLLVSTEPPGIPYDFSVKALLKAGLICEEKTQFQRDSFCDVSADCQNVELTRAQQLAVDKLLPAIRSGKAETFLLHGVTGSGKTEVYLRAAAVALAEGRQVLVMIPEIAQTHQVLRRFKARFGAAVAVVHSRLSVAERRDVWDFFRRREVDIVIGTRSALFLPGAGLGLIIIDEEHEFTYKQEENPRYHVRETALVRAAQLGVTVLLGSATPALESFFAARSGRFRLLTLPERVDGSCLPSVEVVDMREQLKLGRKSVISEPLEKLLKETVEKRSRLFYCSIGGVIQLL
jgi:primosomal protein N' (replication factor Y)